MKLLDLFCGAGGAAMGYHRAGFDEIVGVDIKPQPRYPFTFDQADALEYVAAHGHEFDAIHASPPCQAFSENMPLEWRMRHPDLIDATRAALQATGRPYAIENVEGARHKLVNAVMLCGTMFGLPVWRHRYFETWPGWLMPPATCAHVGRPLLYNPGSNARKGRAVENPPLSVMRAAFGCEWMSGEELKEAIPPVYTEYIGRHLLAAIRERSAT